MASKSPKPTKVPSTSVKEEVEILPATHKFVAFPLTKNRSGTLLVTRICLNEIYTSGSPKSILLCIDPLVGTTLVCIGYCSPDNGLTLNELISSVTTRYGFSSCQQVVLGSGCENDGLKADEILKTMKVSIINDAYFTEFNLIKLQRVVADTLAATLNPEGTQSVGAAFNELVSSPEGDDIMQSLLDLAERFNASPLNYKLLVSNTPLDLLQSTFVLAGGAAVSLAANNYARNCSAIASRKIRLLPSNATLLEVQKKRIPGESFQTYKQIFNSFVSDGWPPNGFAYSSPNTLAAAYRRFSKKLQE